MVLLPTLGIELRIGNLVGFSELPFLVTSSVCDFGTRGLGYSHDFFFFFRD